MDARVLRGYGLAVELVVAVGHGMPVPVGLRYAVLTHLMAKVGKRRCSVEGLAVGD